MTIGLSGSNRYKTADGHIVELCVEESLMVCKIIISYGGAELLTHVRTGDLRRADVEKEALWRADEVLEKMFSEALRQRRVAYFRPVSALAEVRRLEIEPDYSGDWEKAILSNGFLSQGTRQAITDSLGAVLRGDDRRCHKLEEGQFSVMTHSEVTEVYYDQCRYDLIERVEGDDKRLVLRPRT